MTNKAIVEKAWQLLKGRLLERAFMIAARRRAAGQQTMVVTVKDSVDVERQTVKVTYQLTVRADSKKPIIEVVE